MFGLLQKRKNCCSLHEIELCFGKGACHLFFFSWTSVKLKLLQFVSKDIKQQPLWKTSKSVRIWTLLLTPLFLPYFSKCHSFIHSLSNPLLYLLSVSGAGIQQGIKQPPCLLGAYFLKDNFSKCDKCFRQKESSVRRISMLRLSWEGMSWKMARSQDLHTQKEWAIQLSVSPIKGVVSARDLELKPIG